MAPNAVYIIAVWLLAGMALGLLSTSYGVLRKTYRLLPGTAEFLDWFWFVLAACLFLVMAFWTEWGTFRTWAVVFLLLGYLLWSWLAAPVVLVVLGWCAHGQARFVHYLIVPIVAAARFVRRRFRTVGKPPKKE